MKRYFDCKGLIVEFDLSQFKSANKEEKIRQQENIKFLLLHFLAFIQEQVKENINSEYEYRRVFKEYVNVLENTKHDIEEVLKLVKEKEEI